MSKTVHVIFKTHLDVGFTDLAANVVRRYFESYIPQAMQLARELREAAGPERFVWTTGSWLIYEYLEQAAPAVRAAMEAAILSGDIRWHALPFTTHTEAMDPALFRFGLSLSQELDKRFGLSTIAAKMTDVPGHTRGMVPLLVEAGIKFLHIGVNPACRAPDVPDVFRWRDPASGAALTVMYHKANYGSAMTIPGLDHAIAFAHTGDNCGPQSAEHIVKLYAELRQQFPGDRVQGSTMEPFAAALQSIADTLPVVEGELGDTWIHGLGTDPAKMAAFRELCRQRAGWLATGQTKGCEKAFNAFSRKLLQVPEHTWGLDEKTHLGDYVNYRRPEFEAARRRDVVVAPIPAGMEAYAKFLRPGERRFSTFEASWAEQRSYLEDARAALAGTPLAAAAESALAAIKPALPELAGVDWQQPGQPIALPGGGSVTLADSGAITALALPRAGVRWSCAGAGLGKLRYQTFSPADYERYLKAYAINLEHTWCSDWAIPDLTKPGLRPEDSPAASFAPQLRRAGVRRAATATVILAELAFPEAAHRDFGAPGVVWVEYAFPDDAPVVNLCVQWFDKPANRMPEALWCLFCPPVQQPANWRLDKLGTLISPLEVLTNGNRNLHGINSGAVYAGPDGNLRLDSLDAALLAPGRPRLLEFDNRQPELAGGLHFNLYTNVWGTNFPMWNGEPARFRFRLAFGPAA